MSNLNVVIFGATSAIAQAVAELYAKQSAKLFIVGRNEKRLSQLAQHLKILGADEVQHQILDITDCDFHQQLLADASNQFSNLDVIIIAPGVLPGDGKIKQQLADFNINANCTIALAEAAGNTLAAQGKGALAVISSVAGDRGRQSNYWYGAAKGAVSIFLQGLRNKLFHCGVTVTTIKPGFVESPMTANFDKGVLWAKPEEIAPKIINAIAKGSSVTYVPGFWRLIMLIICSIPEFIFKRLKL